MILEAFLALVIVAGLLAVALQWRTIRLQRAVLATSEKLIAAQEADLNGYAVQIEQKNAQLAQVCEELQTAEDALVSQGDLVRKLYNDLEAYKRPSRKRAA